MKKMTGSLPVVFMVLVSAAVADNAIAGAAAPPVKLIIREPVAHNSRGGFAEGRDWNLEFRLRVDNAVGFIELLGNGVTKEALVISDPDACIELDLGHPTYPGPLESCSDGIADEVFFAFRSDPNDRRFVQDTDQCGIATEGERLKDDVAGSLAASEMEKA